MTTLKQNQTVGAIINLPVNDKGKTAVNDFGIGIVQSDRDKENVLQQTFGEKKDHFARPDKLSFEYASIFASPVLKSAGAIASNGFISTVHYAYAQETSLVFAPDDIWTVLLQGFSEHINANANELRDIFVAHIGKKELVVRHDGLAMKESSQIFGDSSWNLVFPQFRKQLSDSVKVPKFVDNVTDVFSTSGELESIVFTTALMDSMQNYFSYKVMTMCGIKQVALLGTKADWIDLRARAEEIGRLIKMDWWLEHLLPFLDRFVQLFDTEGKAHESAECRDFWTRLYEYHAGGSGFEKSCSGYINTLFPFIDGKKRRSLSFEQKIEFKQFPSGTQKVPFLWDYFGDKYPMFFYAGFVAAIGLFALNGSEPVVTPSLCWAVAKQPTK